MSSTDEIIAKQGPRLPDHSQAQRNFPLLPIVVTDKPLTPGDWNFYLWQLEALRAPERSARYIDGNSYFVPPNLRRSLSLRESFAVAMHHEATVELGGAADALVKVGATCVPLPSLGHSCARLQERAAACQIAARACHLDEELTPHDAACIAACAESASCEDLRAADLGVVGGSHLNPYTSCAQNCQCIKDRNCYKAETAGE